MKRFIPFIALLAVVALVGCSGDSPSAKPVPTVVPEAWSITSLTPSNAAPFVNTVILIDATVTKNGTAAPNGTTVSFEASGGAFSSGDTEASVLTSDGTASVAFIAETAGTYVIRAQVGGVSRQISVPYQDRATTDALQLFSIDPRRGSYSGGEQAVILGKGILAPVEVYFDLNGVAYEAIVAGVTESIPASETGSITVVTPAFTGANNTIQQAADVRVIANAGTGSAETDSLPDAFVLLPGGGPQIFGVSPNSGRSSGGEIVNILGQNFGSVASDLSVSFSDDDGVVRLATVVSVAPDGTQIQVETPRFSTLPLTQDRPQDVTVSTVDGGASLEDAFIVLADNPTPEIASISPTSGPLEGGTLVTIFGSGFQAPMQVFFGNLAAVDVNIFNDTTPANQDRITCVTPNYSQQGDVPPVAVDVRVVNMNTGAESSYSSFTYGDNLYISGNSPQEGNAGDLVIIYGSGFVSPLQVFFADTQMNVNSVSGTEILIQIPDSFIDECNGSSGSFKVVLLESGIETEGGNFTILGNAPQVLSVTPVLIDEDDLGTPDADITINGQRFAPDLLVQVGNYIPPSSDVTVVSTTSIDVQDLPGIDELGVSFATTPCTIGGAPGERSTSTAIEVTVTNYPGGCADTLNGAIIIEPTNSVCQALPAALAVSPTAIAFGANEGSQVFTIENTGGTSLDWAIAETDPDNVYTVSPANGTLGFGASVDVTVTFTFAGATDPSHPGTLTISTTPGGIEGDGSTVTLTASTP